MWSSHAAALTLAVTTATVLVLESRAGRRLVMAAIVAVCFGASAVVEYFANLRAVAKITVLQAYWAPGLRPRSASFDGASRWLRTDLVKLATDPLHFAFPAAALIALGDRVGDARGAQEDGPGSSWSSRSCSRWWPR